jgi:hypothetical protein
MAANSQQFMDDLGPLAAIWAGRDQANQENTNVVNQQVGLENIMNSQQKRQFEAEDRPFALDKMKHEQAMRPFTLEGEQQKVEGTKRKFKKEDFDNYMGQLSELVPQLPGTPADGALVAELAKRNNLDATDPRIQKIQQVAASGNKEAFAAMMKQISLADQAHQRKMAEETFKQTQETGRALVQEQGRNQRNVEDNARALEAAKIAAQSREAAAVARQAAMQKMATIDQRLVQLTAIANDPQSPPEAKAQAKAEAQQLIQAKSTIATAVVQEKWSQIESLLNPGGTQQPAPTQSPAPAAGGWTVKEKGK